MWKMTQPTLLLVVAFIASINGMQDNETIFLRLRVVPDVNQIYNFSLDGSCDRGNEGLTDTLIQVQYRLIAELLQNTTVMSEWGTLAEIDPDLGFNGTLDFSLADIKILFNDTSSNESSLTEISFDSVQFRLLQLEHGGGSCNCWTVEELMVLMANETVDLTDSNYCSSSLEKGQDTTGSGSGSGSGGGSARFDSISGNQTDFNSTSGNETDLGSSSGSRIALGSGLVPGSGSGVTDDQVGSGSGVLEIAGVTFCSDTASNARGFISEAVPLLMVNETSMELCPGNSDELLESKGNPLTENCSFSQLKIEVAYELNINSPCGGPEGNLEAIEFAVRTNTSGVYSPWVPLRLIQRSLDMIERNATNNMTFSNDTSDISDDTFEAITTIRGYDVELHTVQADDVTVADRVTICGETLLPDDASEVQFRWMNTVGLQGDTLDTWAILNATADFTYNEDTITIFDANNNFAWDEIRNGDIDCLLCEDQTCNFTSDFKNKTPFGSNLPCNLTFGFENLSNETVQSNIALTVGLLLERPPLPPTLPPTTMRVNDLKKDIFSDDPPDAVEVLNRLGVILDGISPSDLDIPVQTIVDIVEVVISGRVPPGEAESDVIGSSILSVVDRVALEAFPVSGNISSGNVTIQTQLIPANSEDYITTIDSQDFNNDLPEMSIRIPPELIQQFANSSSNKSEEVRVISALYYNVEDLFPGGLPDMYSSQLGSGIVSTSLQCGESLCNTTEVNLTLPVIIFIEHSEELNSSLEATCVFWEFLSNSSDNSSLTSGQWSTFQCFKNDTLSNASHTACECNHLTHFCTLLSPRSLDSFDKNVVISLEAIGAIGVAVSVVAMIVTIVTFLVFKSLYNMRNYIHIHLCVNLIIAQIIFVVGIDKLANDDVPAHCKAIAVLLHYFFLVSFMWMLMEGVVLYFILIRVFVGNTKKYIICFTLASYGIPLLYMGLLTLPLGFGLHGHHYGSFSACFLNPETHFIWAFITPVVVIIFTNIGFLIMAAITLWRQKSQKGKMDRKAIMAWLKALVFLVAVMGITWIMGVLVTEVEALYPLAYIFTIMAAFQGVAIFLSLVAFQKSVREEYIKWFKQYNKASDASNSSSNYKTKSSAVSSLPRKSESESKDDVKEKDLDKKVKDLNLKKKAPNGEEPGTKKKAVKDKETDMKKEVKVTVTKKAEGSDKEKKVEDSKKKMEDSDVKKKKKKKNSDKEKADGKGKNTEEEAESQSSNPEYP